MLHAQISIHSNTRVIRTRKHPDANPGETLLEYATEGIFQTIGWKSKRLGNSDSSSRGDGESITLPIFVLTKELENAGFEIEER